MSADQERNTTAAEAFRKHFETVLGLVQEADLPTLGARFFSRHLISQETMEVLGNGQLSRTGRVSKLMLAVIAHLNAYPNKFDCALGVFKEEPVYTELSSMISGTFENLSLKDAGRKPQMHPPTTAIDKYAAHFKKVYLRSKLPNKGKWPPSPCKKILKLAAIERDQHQRTQVAKLSRCESVDEYMLKNSMTPVSMEDLLTAKGSLSKTVVVQGVPGIGKSTFAWKFCRKWAKGKIYQQYDLVVLLRMRDTRVREAKKLSDLFVHDSSKLSDELVEEILTTEGKGVLLLMEGLDELPASCLADGSPISNLLQGESLPEAAIVVTTRPWAVQILREKCGDQVSRLVEILGFTKKDILRYVSHAFTDEEITSFIAYLNSHPELESIMHIPLNAAFVVEIYKELRQSEELFPRTLTQLYTALVQGLLLRYTKSVPEYYDLKVDLDLLPEPIKSHFEQLCHLAFMSFTKLTVQVTFTDSEAALYGCLDSLGLMQSSADLFVNTGTAVTHSFLHFTIQEFLAAYHLSKQPQKVQKTFLSVHQNDPQFEVLIQFLIGLNHKAVLYLHSVGESISIVRTIQLHWLFESQSPEIVCKYLGKVKVLYSRSLDDLSPFDLYAWSYCLQHSNCTWEVRANMHNLTTLYSPKSEVQEYTSQISSLSVRVQDAKSAKQLFSSLPQRITSTLPSLSFHAYHDSAYSVLTDLIRNGKLPSLARFLIDYEDTTSNIDDMVLAIMDSDIKLESISICQCSFNATNILPLCKYVSSAQSLIDLALADCELDGYSAQLIISAIPCTQSLRYLDLSGTKLNLSALEMLSVAISSEGSSLGYLKMVRCSLGRKEIEALSMGMDRTSLSTLILRQNHMDNHTAAALATMLTENTSLKKIDLSDNDSIGIEGTIKLLNTLEENTSLENLILPSTCEPIEFKSSLMDNIRRSKRVTFVP